MSIIYCYIEPFVINQNIYLLKDGESYMEFQEKVPLEELPSYLVTSYVNNKCGQILIHSNSTEYSNKYVQDIREYALTQYGLNDINIKTVEVSK